MLTHRPHGIEHPYATSPDQRIPVQPLTGEQVRLGVVASADVTAVVCEWGSVELTLTRAETDAVMRAEDWPALAMAPMQVLRPREPDRPAHVPAAAAHQAAQAQPSRKAVVSEALRTLHGALASAPSAHRMSTGRKAATARRRA